jgi:tRNA dimethylallyltransferase
MRTLGTLRDTPARFSPLCSQWVVGRGAPRKGTALGVEVIAIFGPTASGKSAVAHALASHLGTEVVSADALQVYRGLPILTNQPAEPTRLIAVRELSETMSVGEFALLAHEAIDELVSSNDAAVVAGGTGLYLRAALVDLEIPPVVDPASRADVEREYDRDPAAAHERLGQLDPVAAESIHVNDRRRVVRALELAAVGESLVPTEPRLWAESMRRSTLVVGLDIPADELERRICERTDDMIQGGVVEEVRGAMRRELSRTAAQALGLDELTRLPLDEARDRMVLRTRRYAAYQRKWMRRIPGIVLVDADRPTEQVVDAIVDLARAR